MENKRHQKNRPLIFFVLVIASIFFVEFILMFFIEVFLEVTYLVEALIDSIMLSAVISPILYFFSFRILNREIESRQEIDKKYESLFELSPDAILTLYPPDWKFTDGNPAALKMFGLRDNGELNQVSPADLSPKLQPGGKPSKKMAKQMIDIALGKGSHSFLWTHKRMSGQEFSAKVDLIKIAEGKGVFLQAIVHDITSQLKNAEQLRKIALDANKALASSERANKLMVGRELEMIKLKKEINELKKTK